MIELLIAVLTAAIILVGAGFILVATIGLNRLPDLYTRMHAASKAGTVGSGLLLFAAAIHAGDLPVFARALSGFLFFVLTAPVSAHLLAMAAHKTGHRPCDRTVCDEMKPHNEQL